MIKIYMLLAFVLGLTIQTCAKGCLKCNADNKCLLCDLTENYKMDADSCTLVDQPNCSILNVNGDCTSCASGYYLNSTTKKCVAIDTAKVVANCRDYTPSQTCQNCNTNFVIAAAACQAVTVPILNCDINNTQTACAACKAGYFVSLDSKSCEAIPSTTNCYGFQRYECNNCAATYTLNRNLFFKTSYQISTDAEKLDSLEDVENVKNGVKILWPENVCQLITVENCAELETFSTCKTCGVGYFIKEDKTCQAYPISVIANCSIYDSNISCSACNQGFFRVSSSQCQAVTAVENCSSYLTTVNSTQCSQCNPEFYLASASSCLARSVSALLSIANCKTKSINSDKCAACTTGFVLSTQGDQCAAVVTNCLTHNPFTKGNAPTCLTCNNGFYLLSSVCTQGNDANCLTFNNSGTCSVCKPKFYSDGTSVCVQQVEIPNCTNHSSSLKNTCQTCGNNTFNFKIAKSCTLLTEIANCIAYKHDVNTATTPLCQTCKNGFYLSSNSDSCTQITVSNCSAVNTATPTVCTSCNDGYNLYVSTDGTATTECRLPHEFITTQCALLGNTGGNNLLSKTTCINCKINSLPVDYTNQFACINNDYLKDDTIGLLTTQVISGCIKYEDTDAANPLCRMCQSGKFLALDKKSCVTTCNTVNNFGAFQPIQLSANRVLYYNICLAVPTDNTFMKAPSVIAPGTDIVVQCTAGTLTKVNTALDVTVPTPYSNVNLTGSFGLWVSNVGTVTPEVVCPTGYTNINGNPTNTLIDNCQYYIDLTGNAYGCLKCNQYFVGKPKLADSKYIDTCTSMIDCDKTVTYGRIPTYWSKFFSCHKCAADNKIPYLLYKPLQGTTVNYLQFGNYKWVSFTNVNADWTNGVTVATSNNVIECLDNSTIATFRAQLGTTDLTLIADAKIVFVPNCGLGLFDLTTATRGGFTSETIATAAYTNASTTYCAACKPGYAPTTRDIVSVLSCAAIPNCTSSSWFNSCSQCNANYVFGYDDNNGINYTTCVSYNNDANCYAAKAANTACSLCKKGFTKNSDGYCVVVDTPKCQQGQFAAAYINAIDANISYQLWYNEQGAGCNQCDSGYSAVLQKASYFGTLFCAASSYVTANLTNFPKLQDGTTKSKYINNCESYAAGSVTTPVCSKCNANYVIRADGSECITLLNCLVAANSGNVCNKCNTGFGLITGGSCVSGATANCAAYNTDSIFAVATCVSCQVGFYLTSSKTCLPGTVANCLTHTAMNSCSDCQAGYFKITNTLLGTNGQDYCYKFDSALNCAAVTIANEANIGARFTCTSCSVPFSVFNNVPAQVSNIQTNCLGLNLIDNCDSYNLGADLSSSTFLCKACKSGYFLQNSGSSCMKRTVTPVLCKSFQVDADVCQICNDGYFLSTNKKECVIFPSGVIGCTTYSNSTTCTACGVDTWLNAGVCTAVIVADKVANCALYSNATTCTTCQTGFVLEGNTCVAMNVSNCAKVASKDACETCMPGFRLQTNSGKTTCESYTKANCVIYDQNGTNPCTLCNQNFYINATGDCVAVSPMIANCLVNNTQTTCKVCAQGFALSIDAKSCVDASSFDVNCAQVNMPANLSCSICAPGYYFKDGVCTAFTGKPFTSGCFSQNIDDPTICQLCNTGYYMNTSLNCVKNDPVIPPTPEVPDSIQNYKAFLMMLLSVIFMI